MKKVKRHKLKLPRAPLPKQTGGPHVPKPKRKPKHKKDYKDRSQDDTI